MLSMACSAWVDAAAKEEGALSIPFARIRQRAQTGVESCRGGQCSKAESPCCSGRDYGTVPYVFRSAIWMHIQYIRTHVRACHRVRPPACLLQPARRRHGWLPRWTSSTRRSAQRSSTASAPTPETAPAAGDRRRRLGQDQHAGASGGAPDRARRRSAAHPAADLLAPRGAGDGAPRRPACVARVLGLRGDAAAGAALGRHLPRHRRAAAARVRGAASGWTRTSPSTTAAMPKT